MGAGGGGHWIKERLTARWWALHIPSAAKNYRICRARTDLELALHNVWERASASHRDTRNIRGVTLPTVGAFARCR
jgi:hypothetical protein